MRTYGRAVHSAPAYGMNDEFSRVLSQQMEYYSNDPNADRINRLKGEMSQVRDECSNLLSFVFSISNQNNTICLNNEGSKWNK